MPRKPLGEILKQAGLIDESKLRAALAEQERWGGPLGRIMLDMRLVSEQALVQALSHQLNLPAVLDLAQRTVAPEVLALLPADFCRKHALIPLAADERFVEVAMASPNVNVDGVKEVEVRTHRSARIYLAGPHAIERAIDAHYGGQPVVPLSGGEPAALSGLQVIDLRDAPLGPEAAEPAPPQPAPAPVSGPPTATPTPAAPLPATTPSPASSPDQPLLGRPLPPGPATGPPFVTPWTSLPATAAAPTPAAAAQPAPATGPSPPAASPATTPPPAGSATTAGLAASTPTTQTRPRWPVLQVQPPSPSPAPSATPPGILATTTGPGPTGEAMAVNQPVLTEAVGGGGRVEEERRRLAELAARVEALESLLARDEAVLRKLMRLLLDKGLCSRDELQARLREE